MLDSVPSTKTWTRREEEKKGGKRRGDKKAEKRGEEKFGVVLISP